MLVRSSRSSFAALCVVALVACGGDDDVVAGSGGAAGESGMGGTGGTAGTAGMSGTGGTAGSAGTGGTAGSAGTGGDSGTGGDNDDAGVFDPDSGTDAAMADATMPVECMPDFQDNDEDGVCEPTCRFVGCFHGTCSDATGIALCTCEDFYEGELCNDLTPPMEDLVLWLDASKAETFETATLNGVTRWENVLDDSEALIQATNINRPRRVSAGLNGKPSVNFDGANDFVVMTGFDGIKDADAYEIYVYGTFDTNADDTSGVIIAGVNGEGGTAGAGQHGLLFEVNETANGLRLNHRMPFAGAGGVNVATMANRVLSAPTALRALISDVPNVGSVNITQDSAFVTSVEGTVTPFTRNLDLTLGRLSETQAERYLKASISEILVYRRRNTATVAGRVNTYLDMHWAPIL